LEQTKTRKWRWGVNRWWVLGFIILGAIGVNLVYPVKPHIQVAPESLTLKPLFSLPVIGDFYFVNSFTAMLIGDVLLILIAFAVYRSTRSGSLVPKGIASAMEMLMEMLYNMTETSAGKWTKVIFPWFMTILLVVLSANIVKLLPGVETIGLLHHNEEGQPVQELTSGVFTVLATKLNDAGEEIYSDSGMVVEEEERFIVTPFVRALSTDLNFTVALALISVVMTQVIGFRAQGMRYLLKFFNVSTMFKKPFLGFMDLIVSLLELISEFAKILSFSFRLFGNMFAGMVLMILVSTMVPYFMPSMIMFFELFIGAIQAFVFGMLTMVFMSQATMGHGEEEHHEA